MATSEDFTLDIQAHWADSIARDFRDRLMGDWQSLKLPPATRRYDWFEDDDVIVFQPYRKPKVGVRQLIFEKELKAYGKEIVIKDDDIR